MKLISRFLSPADIIAFAWGGGRLYWNFLLSKLQSVYYSLKDNERSDFSGIIIITSPIDIIIIISLKSNCLLHYFPVIIYRFRSVYYRWEYRLLSGIAERQWLITDDITGIKLAISKSVIFHWFRESTRKKNINRDTIEMLRREQVYQKDLKEQWA